MEPFDLPPDGASGSSGSEPRPPWRPSPNWRGAALGLPENGAGALATVRQRFAGAIIDALILLPVTMAAYLLRNPRTESTVDAATGRTHSRVVLDPQPVWLAAIVVLIGAVYVIGLIGGRGKTVGQAAMKIRVVRIGDRQVPGYDVAARRWLVVGAITIVSDAVTYFQTPGYGAITFGLLMLHLLVLLWMVWDPNRQGLHDKFAGTIVIRDSIAVPTA